MLKHFQLNQVEAVELERLLHHKRGRLGAIAASPAILLADHDPEVGRARHIPSKSVSAVVPISRSLPTLMDRVTVFHGRSSEESACRSSCATGFVQRTLIVPKHPGDLVVRIPALECRPILRNMRPQANLHAVANQISDRWPSTGSTLVAGDVVVLAPAPQPGESISKLAHARFLNHCTPVVASLSLLVQGEPSV